LGPKILLVAQLNHCHELICHGIPSSAWPNLSFHFYPFLAHAGLGHNFLPCFSYMATLLSLGFSVVLISSANAFQLLDVGAPRTGTQSMYAAFKMLGLKPRHSGYDLTARDALSC
jgi:hypothetical protein